MNKASIKIVFTDLDGTLLNSNREISPADYDMLGRLGSKNIYRVAVTGRNLYVLGKVLKDGDPIDYVIFSTGAGILNWKTKQLIYSRNLQEKEVQSVINILFEKGVNFMLHREVPENHLFYYYHNCEIQEDFNRRLDLYRKFAKKYEDNCISLGSQFVVILEQLEEFIELKSHMHNVKVVRATSPLDNISIWMEIFHQDVSKAKGCEWLCQHLGIEQQYTLSIGNDYNDEDMLQWTAKSFVVENAVEELKQKYMITKSNNDSGFSEALKKNIKLKREIVVKKSLLMVLSIMLVVFINCSDKSETKVNEPKLSNTETHNDCGSCSSECDSELKIKAGEEKEIEWMTNIDEALKLASETDKILMVDFMAKWCPPCKQMEKITFPDHNVICKSENFITVRIDVDEQQEVANTYNGNAGKYGGIGIPNILFIDKNKNVKRHIVGFHEPEKLVSVMDSVLTGKYEK